MDKIEELKKLKGLLDNGLVSQEEFNVLKSEILGNANTETIENNETNVKALQDKKDEVLKAKIEVEKANLIERKTERVEKFSEIEKPIVKDTLEKKETVKEKNQVSKWAYLFLLLLVPLGWWMLNDVSISEGSPESTYESNTSIPENSNYQDLKLKSVSCYEGNECSFEFVNSNSKLLTFDWFLEPTYAEEGSFESVFMKVFGTGYDGFEQYYGNYFRVYYDKNERSPGQCIVDDNGRSCTKILNMYLLKDAKK